MNTIVLNTDLIPAAGYSEYEINTDRDLELTITVKENCDLFFRIKKAKSLRIRTMTAGDKKASILFWNDANQKIEFDESHEVMGNGELHVAYGECNGADTKRETYVALREEGATATLSSASLVNCNKDYRMQVVNFAPHTYGDMQNYSVVMGNGRLSIDAIGKIVKGAHRSESHQTSRALSFEKGQHALILPELLIDEDDVQASHAMSMGRVDEDQLYYLQSRGLSNQQCVSLISTGYLMPITETIQVDSLKEKLKEEMEGKLAELC